MFISESLRASDVPKRQAAIQKATQEHNHHLTEMERTNKGECLSFNKASVLINFFELLTNSANALE